MSWDAYINTLMEAPNATDAAIYGLDGNLWASTCELKDITGEQINALTCEISKLHACGPMIGKKKCMFLRKLDGDQDILQLKTKENPNISVCVGKTKKALVVLIGNAKPPELTTKVFGVVKHLVDNNY
ncbi:profilin-1-like [Clinocottus analis]|uniref:profilin-1-like n=1 Tax=Clinocottus analis TaxID=304258 RepID=UPI0035BF928A